MPTISGNGFSGLSTFGPYQDFSNNLSLSATLSKVFGAHTMKYGFSFAKIRKNENSLGGTNEEHIQRRVFCAYQTRRHECY